MGTSKEKGTEPGPEKKADTRETRKLQIKKVGGATALFIPIEMMREQGWGPRDSVWVVSTPGKGLTVEKFKQG